MTGIESVLESALRILRQKFPEATLGVDNDRPYARMPDGTLYGILFGIGHDGGQVAVTITDVPAKRSIEIYCNREETLTLATAFKESAPK